MHRGRNGGSGSSEHTVARRRVWGPAPCQAGEGQGSTLPYLSSSQTLQSQSRPSSGPAPACPQQPQHPARGPLCKDRDNPEGRRGDLGLPPCLGLGVSSLGKPLPPAQELAEIWGHRVERGAVSDPVAFLPEAPPFQPHLPRGQFPLPPFRISPQPPAQPDPLPGEAGQSWPLCQAPGLASHPIPGASGQPRPSPLLRWLWLGVSWNQKDSGNLVAFQTPAHCPTPPGPQDRDGHPGWA